MKLISQSGDLSLSFSLQLRIFRSKNNNQRLFPDQSINKLTRIDGYRFVPKPILSPPTDRLAIEIPESPVLSLVGSMEFLQMQIWLNFAVKPKNQRRRSCLSDFLLQLFLRLLLIITSWDRWNRKARVGEEKE